jgi:predicted permease
VLALLAGWSFDGSPGGIVALAVLLAAQLTAVGAGALLFRRHDEGPLMSFSLYGNPGFWSVPVTAAVFGSRAAVVIATYDLLTQPRVVLGMRLMRARAPTPQRARTAAVDYSPTVAAVSGLLLGRVVAAPPAVPEAVVILGTVMSGVGAVMLGLAWPCERWIRRGECRLVGRVLAVHLTVVPGALLGASLIGVGIPDGAWILALGPLPISSLALARVFGFSPRLAACGISISMGVAAALIPLAAFLAQRLPA